MANNQKKMIPRRTDGTDEQNSTASKAPAKYETVRTLGDRDLSINHLMKRLEDGVRLVFKTYNTQGCVMKGEMPLEVFILTAVLPSHPLIINCQNYRFLPDGRPRIVFDYYEGRDLGKLISSTKDALPESLLWDIFIQLAEALALLHYGIDSKRPGEQPKTWRPVVHAAIKPSNIFCRQKYILGGTFPPLVLGDFSLAFVGHSQRGGGGLSMFQPPEYPLVSAKKDIWGLGATIHALAHRKLTILNITSAARKELDSGQGGEEVTKVIDDWLSITGFPKRYSKELKNCMQRCLELDKEKRIDSKDLVKMLSKERGY